MTDAALVARVFQEHRIRHVFHLAAYAAEGLSHFIRRYNYETNLLASVNLINQSVNQVLAMAPVRDSILNQGNEIGGGTPESFAALIRAEIPRWAKVVKDANIQPE